MVYSIIKAMLDEKGVLEMRMSNKKLFALIVGIAVIYGLSYWIIGGLFIN